MKKVLWSIIRPFYCIFSCCPGTIGCDRESVFWKCSLCDRVTRGHSFKERGL